MVNSTTSFIAIEYFDITLKAFLSLREGWPTLFTLQNVFTILALFLAVWSYMPTFMGVKAPYAGYSSNFVPGAWARFQFTKGARQIVDEGYIKASTPRYSHYKRATALTIDDNEVERCHVQALTDRS